MWAVFKPLSSLYSNGFPSSWTVRIPYILDSLIPYIYNIIYYVYIYISYIHQPTIIYQLYPLISPCFLCFESLVKWPYIAPNHQPTGLSLRVCGLNPSLKNARQLGWLFPIYGKIKHVPNHQPDYVLGASVFSAKPISHSWFYLMLYNYISSLHPIMLALGEIPILLAVLPVPFPGQVPIYWRLLHVRPM